MVSEWYLTEWSNGILNGTYKNLFSFFVNDILNGIPHTHHYLSLAGVKVDCQLVVFIIVLLAVYLYLHYNITYNMIILYYM